MKERKGLQVNSVASPTDGVIRCRPPRSASHGGSAGGNRGCAASVGRVNEGAGDSDEVIRFGQSSMLLDSTQDAKRLEGIGIRNDVPGAPACTELDLRSIISCN